MTVFPPRTHKAALYVPGHVVVSPVMSQPGWTFLGFLLLSLLTGCALLPGGIGSPQTTSDTARQARILITSSPALLPLISATAVLFERQHPQVQIDIRSTELSDSLNAVVSQQADIAATIRYADPSISSTMNLVDQLTGIVPFTLIAHAGIDLPSLSDEQILGIFSTGTITNWKQVGGPDQKIVVVVPPMDSDIRFLFREEMLGGSFEISTALAATSLETLPQMVARTPGSVSYLPGPLLNADVHVLAVNGVQPTSETIASGHYPFWSFAHLFIKADMIGSGTGASDERNQMRILYLHFLQSTAADHLAQQLGYIPLSEIQLPPLLKSLTAKSSPSSAPG